MMSRAVRFLFALVAGAPALAAQAPPPSITGVVYDSLRTRAPLRDVSVMITESGKVASTDARGRFRFDSIPDGKYHLTFFWEMLDSLGIGAPTATVTVAKGLTSEAVLATPSAPELYRRLCGPPKDKSVAAVVGRVRDVDTGLPIAAATVETFWAEFEYVAKSFKRRLFKATTRTGSTGSYILCGVPSDVPLDITARAGVWQAGPITVVHDRDVIAHRELAISRRDSAARADSNALMRDSTAIPVGSGIIRGRVTDRAGRPVPNAPVRVVADSRETRSREDGSFVLTGVPAGTRMLEARAIGYGPATADVDVPTSATTTASIVFDRRAQELKPITIVGQKPRADITGFTERARSSVGIFVTEDDLKRRPVVRLGDALLRGTPITYDMTQIGPEVKMRAMGTMENDSRCIPNFYLDGMFVPPPDVGMRQTMLQSIEALVYPTDVKGIEVYNSVGGIPPEFNRNNGCGSIVIWTR